MNMNRSTQSGGAGTVGIAIVVLKLFGWLTLVIGLLIGLFAVVSTATSPSGAASGIAMMAGLTGFVVYGLGGALGWAVCITLAYLAEREIGRGRS